jgi:uncharacterized protein DUF6444
MQTERPFSPELWEQTPPAVQAYIRAVEARLAALEAAVQDLTERLQQDSRTSSRPPSSDLPQATTKRPRRDRAILTSNHWRYRAARASRRIARPHN